MASQDQQVQGPAGHAVLAADNKYDADRKDPFWFRGNVDSLRWNRSYPYQLLVVKQKFENGKASYYQDEQAKKYSFTLPFTPRALRESWIFAHEGGVTQGGFVDQRNGSPLRPLTFSGTLGVLPLRGSAPRVAPANFAEAAFAGTIANVTRVANAATTAIAQFQGPSKDRPNLVPQSEFVNDRPIGKTTGYFQLQLLKRFLESWLAFAKSKAGKDYWIAFAAWKQRQVYLVRIKQFDAEAVADSPLEYQYSFAMEAFRAINLDQGPPSVTGLRPGLRDSNVMAKCLTAIQLGRQAIQASRDALSAVTADVDRTLFEPLREAALFMIDALSLPPAFADLPKSLSSLCFSSIMSFVDARNRSDGLAPLLQGLGRQAADDFQLIADAAAQAAPPGTTALPPFGTRGFASAGISGPAASQAYDPFVRPEDHFEFFSALSPSSMILPPAAAAAIENERARVRAFTRSDFEARRDSVAAVRDAYAALAGMGDDSYDKSHGLTPPAPARTPTSADFDTAHALNRAVLELERLSVAAPGPGRAGPSLGFLQALHARAGIPFEIPNSKFLAPFPAGSTLEQLALRYLGDPDRVGEIVAVNNLRPPYVDEAGFSLPLLAPGSGNEVVVGSADNLEAGQAAWISSSAAPTAMRRIVSVSESSPGFVVVTLDGDPTMGSYKSSDGAALRAHLPGTVSSQNPIWIPSSDQPEVDDFGTPGSGLVGQSDLAVAVSGVDWLLDSKGDLVFSEDGDTRLATGTVNVLQQARIILSLKKGALLRHPQIGLEVPVGSSLADFDPQQLLKAAQEAFDGDPAFTGVEAAAVSAQGPTAKLGLQLGIRGLPRRLPVTFDVEV